jgi:hypothetical protein
VTKTAGAAPRKPRKLKKMGICAEVVIYNDGPALDVWAACGPAEGARLLADWLLQYAAWAEHQKKGKRK